MTNHDEQGDDPRHEIPFVEIGPDDTGIRRINVAVTPETVEALQRIIGREEINLSEAVRRLVAYGDLVYREIAVEGNQVLIRGHGCDREVTFLAAEAEETCGDCIDGHCHWGSAGAAPGEECGCERHEASVRAR